MRRRWHLSHSSLPCITTGGPGCLPYLANDGMCHCLGYLPEAGFQGGSLHPAYICTWYITSNHPLVGLIQPFHRLPPLLFRYPSLQGQTLGICYSPWPSSPLSPEDRLTLGSRGGLEYINITYRRGPRYLIIKELGLKDHDYYGFWGLSP